MHEKDFLNFLQKKSRLDLMDLCKRLVVSSNGTKTDLSMKIIGKVSLFTEKQQKKHRIVSLDLGVSNLACAELVSHKDKASVAVGHWTLNDLKMDNKKYEITQFAGKTVAFVQETLSRHAQDQKPGHSSLFFVEKQLPISQRGNIKGNYKMLALEAMIIALLTNSNQKVESASSLSISNLFGLRDASTKRSYTKKKNASTLLVRKWLNDGRCYGETFNSEPIRIEDSREWLRYFESHKKKDDLADAFIMGVAQVYASIHAQQLLDEFHSSES